MSFLSKSLTLLLTTTVLNSAYSSSINVINNINDSSFNTPTLNSIKIENGASNNNKNKNNIIITKYLIQIIYQLIRNMMKKIINNPL